MYSGILNFFNDNNSIYPLQFGFRQKYSLTHALISLTGYIRKNLDEGNIGCGIFVDLQKAFDTVEHDILLAKVEHYGICGLANEWFRSYLSNSENNMFQLMVMNQVLFLFYVMYRKVQSLVHFCF